MSAGWRIATSYARKTARVVKKVYRKGYRGKEKSSQSLKNMLPTIHLFFSNNKIEKRQKQNTSINSG